MSVTVPTPTTPIAIERLTHDLLARPWAHVDQLREQLIARAAAGDPAAARLLPVVVEAIDLRPEGRRRSELRARAAAEGAEQMRRRRRGRCWVVVDPDQVGNRPAWRSAVLDRPIDEAHRIFSILARHRHKSTHNHLFLKAG